MGDFLPEQLVSPMFELRRDKLEACLTMGNKSLKVKNSVDILSVKVKLAASGTVTKNPLLRFDFLTLVGAGTDRPGLNLRARKLAQNSLYWTVVPSLCSGL